jgi:hypothetical protein
MSTEANRREHALIEAAFAGDLAAAHALLDHLREQDENVLADDLAPLLATVDGARQVAACLTLRRISRMMADVTVPVIDAVVVLQKAMSKAFLPLVSQMFQLNRGAPAAAAQRVEAIPPAADVPAKKPRARKRKVSWGAQNRPGVGASKPAMVRSNRNVR